MKKNPNKTYPNNKKLFLNNIKLNKTTKLITLTKIITTNLKIKIHKKKKPFLFPPNKQIKKHKSKNKTLPSKKKLITPKITFYQ